jgi:hypothetical protein
VGRPKILLQLDADAQASVFDGVVALDAGVDQLLSRGAVQPAEVQDLVHGAIFTRGPKDLHHTAIFIGGSDVAAGERLLDQVQTAFFGPLRVSVMLDASGANTTAAAAVVAAGRHLDLSSTRALVLGATGPVGQRVAELLARQGTQVTAASRRQQRAQDLVARLQQRGAPANFRPMQVDSAKTLQQAVSDVQLVIAAGAAGAVLFPEQARSAADRLKVAIDLNAVPPLGIPWIEVSSTAKQLDAITVYGALGIGGLKMKIHKACIRRLFERNDQVLDAVEIHTLGQQI